VTDSTAPPSPELPHVVEAEVIDAGGEAFGYVQ